MTAIAEEETVGDLPSSKNLWTVIDRLDRADQIAREHLVKKWRKQMYYWDSIQYVWWSEFAHDWRTPEQATLEDPQADIDPTLYAKVVNIYRAYGEVIIAAMSAALPTVPFFPDDADNADDIATAKAYTHIGILIQKHNYAELLFMKALYILYNQGVVFGYNENREDKQFGVVKQPISQPHVVTSRSYYCSSCGYGIGEEELSSEPVGEPTPMDTSVGQEEMGPSGPMPEEMPPSEPLEMGMAGMPPQVPQGPPPQMIGMPPEGPAPMGGPPEMPPQMPPMQGQKCPQCGAQMEPDSEDSSTVIPRIIGESELPKSREVIEVYGPLNIKIAPWATKGGDFPALILETEEHYAKLQDIYPEIADKIQPQIDFDTYDRSMRIPASFAGDIPGDLCTVRRCWLRPWAYNVLGRGGNPTNSTGNMEEDIDELRELYPEGCYVVIINRDLVAECIPDKLDDHWTWSEHPLSETIHAESTGSTVIPIQDMTNESWNLTLEGIEFGIPEVFADPDVLDFDEYGKSEARPGQVTPAKAPAGRSLGEAFFEAKTSSISQEIDKFMNRLERIGQFVSGALPTVFGGAIQGGTGTAREYEMSRSQALQRLQITWKIVKIWWSNMLSKAVRSFAMNMVEDERYVAKRGSSFVNVWIRMAHTGGKVGEIEPDVNESFPISWAQKRDMILNMFQSGNEDVMAVLRHSENAGIVSQILGVPELYIPGDDDRNKQLHEISILIQGQPIEMAPPMESDFGAPPEGIEEDTPSMPGPPQPQLVSTVAVDPELDNHEVEAATCKAWLISEVGLATKVENPGAYMNVLLHYKEHFVFVQMAQAAEVEAEKDEEGKAPPKGKPNA